MPVLAVVTHLTLIHTDGLATVVTVLSEHRVEAEQTIRFALSHYITLTAQLLLALLTRKVVHMPGTSFRLGAFIGEDYLRQGEMKETEMLNKFES